MRTCVQGPSQQLWLLSGRHCRASCLPRQQLAVPVNCSCTACRHRLQMSTSIVCRPSHRAYNAQALILSPTAWCVPVCRPCCSTCVAAAACWTTGTCGAAASVPGLRWCGGAARCSSWLTCSWDRRRACAPASLSACRGAARAVVATCGCGCLLSVMMWYSMLLGPPGGRVPQRHRAPAEVRLGLLLLPVVVATFVCLNVAQHAAGARRACAPARHKAAAEVRLGC